MKRALKWTLGLLANGRSPIDLPREHAAKEATPGHLDILRLLEERMR